MENYVLYIVGKDPRASPMSRIMRTDEEFALWFSDWAFESDCITSFAFWLGADAPGLEW
jgi:hypothetical protein